MRTITVQLWVNDGTGAISGPSDVSANVTELGEISWSLDDRFTKVDPGQLSVRVWDEGGVLWAWLSTQLQTMRGTASQLLRPWITVTVAGSQAFMGLVDLSSIKRNRDAREVDLSADDWSVLLQDVALAGSAWRRTYPKGAVGRAQAGPFTGSRADAYAADTLHFDDDPDAQVGELLQLTTGGATHRVLSKAQETAPTFKGYELVTGTTLRLEGWSTTGTGSWNFNRLASGTSDLTYYSVAKAVTPSDTAPVRVLRLDTVDGVFPGDVLTAPKGGDMRVLDVDAERNELTLQEPITQALALADKIYYSEDTQAQLVFQDTTETLRRAVAPYAVDVSRLQLATLPQAVLSWLPLQSAGLPMQRITELEPTLTALRLLGQTAAWTGSPSIGWTSGAVGTRYVDWTCLTTAAPARLIPDDREAYTGMTTRRNRFYSATRYNHPIFSKTVEQMPDVPEYHPALVGWPGVAMTWDYAQFRRLVVANPSGLGGTSTLAEARWSGTAWGTTTTGSWPVAGWHPLSVAPMVGTAATTGPVSPQGLALLALAMNDSDEIELQLVHAGAPVRLAVGSAYDGGELVTTPWGVYLVASGGYGRVRYTGSALALDWVQIYDPSAGVLIPSSWAATAAGISVLVALQTVDAEGKSVQDTVMLSLSATPDPANAAAAVSFRETVCTGRPSLVQAVRDPSDATRIVGILGGRLYQVAPTLPATIERMRAEGLTAIELVEHVAQLLNAMVIPRPNGTLQVVSRETLGAVTALTVDQVQVDQIRMNKNFFSSVRCTGALDDLYADAWGPVLGGGVLELQSHPLVWTEGGCFAMAAAYALFCGTPRQEQQETWFHEDARSAPPWEALAPWGRVAVNGGATSWHLTALSNNLITGEATATLLEDV